MRKVVLNRKVSSSELVKEYLKNGGNVTKCPNYTGSSLNKPKRAKNKNFVSDKEFSTGRRTGSVL